MGELERSVHRSYGTMRLAHLGTLLLLGLPACSGLAATEPLPPTADGGSPPYDGAPSPQPEDGGVDRGGDEATGGAPGVCYDGEDNDRDLAVDCADSGCTADPVCCVGSAACCPFDPPLDLRAPEGCADVELGACGALDAAAFVPFGDPGPAFEAGGLVPRGGASWGGASLGGPVDPRASNLRLSAEIQVPEGRCPACIDAAGVGLLETLPAAGERAAVSLALLVNGGRSELQLLVAGVPVETRPLGPPGTLSVELELRIDGTAHVAAGDLVVDLEGIAVPERLQPVVLGRTRGREGAPAVSVRSASLEVGACDVPSALFPRPGSVLPAGSSSWAPSALGRPTRASVGDRTWVAFADAGEIRIARPTPAGDLEGSAGGGAAPDLLVVPPAGYEALLDPWLLAEADQLTLYVAAEGGDGKRALLRGGVDPADGTLRSSLAPVEVPRGDFDSIDGPSVVLDPAEGEAVRRMVARVWRAGEPSLVAFRSVDDGLRFEYASGSLESSVIRSPVGDDVFAIDRDEVAAPALLQSGGIWRLYYGARRGGRWSIGLLVSGDGDHWRPLGRVLAGDPEGASALGVRDPAPFETPSGVALYYVASDGITSVLELATPEAP